MIKSAGELLAKMGGGRIVASNDLCNHQIAEAKVNNKFYVDEEGYGYAIIPWNLTTDKDEERKANQAK